MNEFRAACVYYNRRQTPNKDLCLMLRNIYFNYPLAESLSCKRETQLNADRRGCEMKSVRVVVLNISRSINQKKRDGEGKNFLNQNSFDEQIFSEF